MLDVKDMVKVIDDDNTFKSEGIECYTVTSPLNMKGAKLFYLWGMFFCYVYKKNSCWECIFHCGKTSEVHINRQNICRLALVSLREFTEERILIAALIVRKLGIQIERYTSESGGVYINKILKAHPKELDLYIQVGYDVYVRDIQDLGEE